MSKHISFAEAASLIPDNAVVSVSSSSGLGCPDMMLKAIGERFDETGHPQNITTLHPIAAGDMSGIKGVDYIAKKGLLKKIIGGSYPSGPSSAEPPLIWQMITNNEIPAYNIPSGILFDMHREAAAKRPGVMTKVGLDTFVDPKRQGSAMNDKAREEPVVKQVSFEGEDWLYFPNIVPHVTIIRQRRRMNAATSPMNMRVLILAVLIRRWLHAIMVASSLRRSNALPRKAR